jgi:hypothetical protein
MSFFRRVEMDTWFSHLHKDNTLEILFDNYYLCLMMGFATLRDDSFDGGAELLRHFPGQYAGASKLIIGLLLVAETRKMGKSLTKKRDVEFLVNQYLHASANESINEEGFKRLNCYANGGFNYMLESLPDKPYHADAFFHWYTEQLQALTAGSALWSSQTEKIL